MAVHMAINNNVALDLTCNVEHILYSGSIAMVTAVYLRIENLWTCLGFLILVYCTWLHV